VARHMTLKKGAAVVLVLVIALIGALSLGTVAANAQTTECDPYVEDCTQPRREQRRPPNPDVQADLLERGGSQPTGETGGQAESGTLPFTGADLTLFVVTGVALVGTGTILVRRTRARRSDSS
jgi:hypothetical protein